RYLGVWQGLADVPGYRFREVLAGEPARRDTLELAGVSDLNWAGVVFIPSSGVCSVPAKNIYHDADVHALTADGWTITDDPLRISFGGKDLCVDLGAERLAIAAERGGERIAVEVQSFLNPSPVRDLQEAVGQYEIYRALLTRTHPDRRLYLAVP